MCVGVSLDELGVNSEALADSLDASFQKVGDAELLPDLTRVARISALIKIRRRATDYLELGDQRKVGSDFILHASREIGVLFFVTEIVERQNRDALFGDSRWRKGSCGNRDRRSGRPRSLGQAPMTNGK